MLRKTLTCILILTVNIICVSAQNNRFITLSHVKARPLAMGGAFTAVEGDLAAINFNPAAFSLFEVKKSKRFTFFLNPVAPIIGTIENKMLFQGSGSKIDDYLFSLGLLLKSISLSLGSIDFSFLLSEESLNLPDTFVDEKFFRVSGFRQNHSHTFAARLKLADRVSLGGSASVLFGSQEADPLKRERGFGFSYGILLKPEKGLNIGVSFFNMPDSLKEFRLQSERIVDESVNVGVSYQPFSGTLLSLDVRNLGEEGSEAVREFHFGFEQVIFSHIAIRGGFFLKGDGDNVFSGGVGLFDWNTIFDLEDAFSHRNFVLNYAFVYEETGVTNDRRHFLSFLLRL